MKVAFVYDRITKWGGAERVLLALHKIWSEAPLYTAVYDPDKAPWAKVFDVRSSFLQYVPFAKSHHEFLPLLTPFAFESFSFDEFDVVISITSAEAKNIITKPQTLHVCYCLTPTRYLWSGLNQYQEAPGNTFSKKMLIKLAPTLRQWDRIAGSRPDHYIAISNRVKARIKTYYERDVERVIYPPVDCKQFTINSSQLTKENSYFLVVSRLVGYKRIDIIIDAFNRLGLPLVVIGDGLARNTLVSRARKNISFVTKHLTDEELHRYYEHCRALVIAADEDFGLAAIEANAAGKPVVAFQESGVAEIIIDKKTGTFFRNQTPESLIDAMYSFEAMKFDTMDCLQNAMRFTIDQFTQQMKRTIETLFSQSKNL